MDKDKTLTDQLRTLTDDDGPDVNLDVIDEIISHRLQQDDVRRILRTLGQQDRASFVAKLGDILGKTSALLEISRKVADSLSLDVLLPKMVELVSDFLFAERTTIFLYDEDTNELFSRVAQGDLAKEIRIPATVGIAGAVFQSHEELLISDPYSDPRFSPETDRQTGFTTRNILCLPIRRAGNEVIGVVQVLNRREGDFDEADVTLLRSIALQAAPGFVNARLHEQVAEARRHEQQLLEVTTAISQELQLDALLQKVMETVTSFLGADRSTLFLYDTRTRELWSRVAQGVGTGEIRFPHDVGIAGSVFTSGQTINIPDAYDDDRFNPQFDLKSGYKTDTILCMAVNKKGGERVGVIQVLNKRGGPFTASDERRLQALAAQVAIAIENAQLFAEMADMKNYNESILKSMSNSVVTVSADDEIEYANDAALRLFGSDADSQGLVGEDIHDFFSEENAWIAEAIDSTQETGEATEALDVELGIGAVTAAVNMQTRPLTSALDERLGAMLVLEDISSEKRLRSTMARYLTKEVADKLLDEGESALGGTLQEATILFTDIRSFTTLSEVLGPRDTVTMLNDYFSIMVDVILEHGGILDKYIGDAIMAVFGVPFQGEQDADSAVQAAIEMMRSLHRFNDDRQGQGLDPVLMGVGVNSGEVVSGNIGSPRRMDYTVIGDGVNLAARLEGATKVYGTDILVSEMSVQQLKGQYALRELDRVTVKGKTEPVAVYELLDHLDETRFPARDRVMEHFGAGLQAFRSRDWRGAREQLEAALQLHPGDAASRLYLDRCAYFVEHPPPADWDGTWTMTHK